MDWAILWIAVPAFALLFIAKRLGLVSAEAARAQLQEGAIVVDVRSPSEYQSGHLTKAINLPLGEIGSQAERRLPQKHQAILLHCLSGGRSAIAKRQLRSMGYTRVSNLGSYSRAGKIVGG
jgi:phage shock protein E